MFSEALSECRGDQQVEWVHARLRSRGHRLTRPRKVIIDELSRAHGHPTAAEIVRAVTAAYPGVGRASIFRTLDLLERVNVVHTTATMSGATAYVLLRPDGHHAHIICPICRVTTEITDCAAEPVIDAVERARNVTVLSHMLELVAVCPECAAAAAS